MKKKIIILLFTLFILTTSFFVCYSMWGTKNQSVEIKNEFKKDSIFIQDDLSDLPLIKFDAINSKKDYFVILISGDGGWRGFINKVGQKISEKGIPVIGLNTIPYLDTLRTPQRIAHDINRIIKNFSHIWKKDKAFVGGYSFGGEIIPFAYNSMDAKEKSIIEKIFLIAPSNLADFKVSRTYTYNPKKSKPVIPELINIEASKLIIFCDTQTETICKYLPQNQNYDVTKLPYSHLFIGKTDEVSETIASKLNMY